MRTVDQIISEASALPDDGSNIAVSRMEWALCRWHVESNPYRQRYPKNIPLILYCVNHPLVVQEG